MRFVLDESVDARLAAYLRGLGHDATAIAVDYIPSIEDIDVLDIAYSEQRILITNDRDFGELVFRLGRPHAGVILLRLSSTALDAKIDRIGPRSRPPRRPARRIPRRHGAWCARP